MISQKADAIVADIMVRDVRTVSQKATVNAAASLLAVYGIRHLVVVDETNRVAGMFSERDLMKHTIRCLSRDEHPGTSTVAVAMVDSPMTVTPETALTEAADILATKKIGCLPVVDENKTLCGIVSVIDVLREKGKRVVQPGSKEDIACHKNNRDEVIQLVDDFEMAKEVYESHASHLVALVHELQIENERAEASVVVKQDFLANMSHEIRTPMTAILGFTEVLLENLSEESCIDAARAVHRNGEHLLCIINDILDFSKIDADRLELEHIPCSVRDLVYEVYLLLSPKAVAKHVLLDLDIQGEMPETIATDPVRLRQILINLVGNAIKFTTEGTVRIIARHLQNEGESLIEFEVIDTGIGISDEQFDSIFDPFTQADNTTERKYGGTGLGLAISKRLVGLLGGEISIDSQIGKGSTFCFTIEAHPVCDLRQTAAEAETSRDTTNERMSKQTQSLDCHVLLVEDGIDNQRLIEYILKKNGAKVTVVENGKIACDLALNGDEKSDRFDVVLMDMQMPVMDGYTATKKLRDSGFETPIIALTARAMVGDREKCLDAGCDKYLTKPICRPELVEAIAESLRTRAVL